MFCKKCGKEINDDAVICIYCGCSTEENNSVQKNDDFNVSKTGIGVLLGLFLGIIGLVIGICLYPTGTIARKTFLKAWGITFGICVAVIIIFYIIVIAAAASTVSSYNSSYYRY